MIVEFLTVVNIILGYVIGLLTIIQHSTSVITDPNVYLLILTFKCSDQNLILYTVSKNQCQLVFMLGRNKYLWRKQAHSSMYHILFAFTDIDHALTLEPFIFYFIDLREDVKINIFALYFFDRYHNQFLVLLVPYFLGSFLYWWWKSSSIRIISRTTNCLLKKENTRYVSMLNVKYGTLK